MRNYFSQIKHTFKGLKVIDRDKITDKKAIAEDAVNKAMTEQGHEDYGDENTHFNGYDVEEYLSVYKNDKYEFKEIEHFGGEGEGDSMWKVFEIKNLQNDKIINFRLNAWYDSWNGAEWDGELEIVEPYEVTVTRWKGVK